MKYDTIKKGLGVFFNRSPFMRRTFYNLLDILLLRAWYVHYELKKWAVKAPKKVHILDAGAGFGQYTYYLSSLNPDWNILAVDVKEDQVSDCNTFFQRLGRTSVLFKTGDLTKFREEEAFDLVLSVDVMEHIEEDVDVFKNFYYSLKPGGMLLVSTPSDQGGSDVHEDDDTSFIEEHVRDGYNIDEIREKMKSAGFSKVEARYSYGPMGKISWRLSMKYPILMLGMSKLFYMVLPFYYLITFPVSFVLNAMDVRGNHQTGSGLIVKACK